MMNWKIVVGGLIVSVFLFTWIVAMIVASGMTLSEIIVGFVVIFVVSLGIILLASGLVDFFNGD